jgi:FkbM family methyltransferase
MFKRISRKYRREGLYGIKSEIIRRLFHPNEPPFSPIPSALETIFADGDFTIVQIGAYIGDTSNDPLFATLKTELKKGRGLLICVEPVREYFDALVRNYRDIPNVVFENVAIADHDGQAKFYRLGVDPVQYGHPEWLSQLGSLKKERMEALWDKYESIEELKKFYLQHRIEETIDCISFQKLLRRHDIGAVDLLQIDTEGYELEILATIDFSLVPIRFINYESTLLHERTKEADELMRSNGYTSICHGQDTFCYKRGDRGLIMRCGKLLRLPKR